MESEFFGYEEGAFTGAKRGGSIGIFERANGGTLFLDEISEIPFNLQARLLRAIQENEIRKVGANYSISIDVRIIAATNKDIYQMVEDNQFRRDLYYRLNVFPISLPPLRKRADDIEMLCRHLLEMQDKSRNATKEFYLFARAYSWPGNIRELRNLIEFMCVTTDSDIGVRNLPDYLKKQEFFDKISFDDKISFRELLMLKSIAACRAKGIGTGRRSLCVYFSESYYEISEMETRKVLVELEQNGLIIIQKGRAGCEFTEAGRHYVD
jgi:transcriptional regulator with PAS, ATPase and Fis domain